MFSALAFGANRVDCFDINPLTYRYYHLRKWLLEWRQIDADGQSLRDLLYIVNNHIKSNCKNELESVIFWQYYLNKINNIHFYSSPFFEYIEKPNVSYKNKLKSLINVLKCMNIDFDNIDICENQDFNSNKKYDMVFISNILDYNRSQLKLEIACKNELEKVKEKGTIVCTSMAKSGESINREKNIFLNFFDYDELFTDKQDEQSILYYQYIKK